jgi:hypothetical protein
LDGEIHELVNLFGSTVNIMPDSLGNYGDVNNTSKLVNTAQRSLVKLINIASFDERYGGRQWQECSVS